MTSLPQHEIPGRASDVAAKLAEYFGQDSALAEQQNDAQHRLERANQRLWSGLHPDALGLLYDDTHAIGIRGQAVTKSEVGAVIVDQLRAGAGEDEVTTAVLPIVQEIRWQTHRAFLDYQRVTEDRRHLAAEVGELIRELVDVLTAAGWSEDEARTANVDELAAAGT